jgi:hypothetical protein
MEELLKHMLKNMQFSKMESINRKKRRRRAAAAQKDNGVDHDNG